MIAKESPEWFVRVANIPIAGATLPSSHRIRIGWFAEFEKLARPTDC
jgi:hypothetical protein